MLLLSLSVVVFIQRRSGEVGVKIGGLVKAVCAFLWDILSLAYHHGKYTEISFVTFLYLKNILSKDPLMFPTPLNLTSIQHEIYNSSSEMCYELYATVGRAPHWPWFVPEQVRS